MIKKLSIFAVMAFATATPAKAAELTQDEVSICETLGALAEDVMLGRQLNASPIAVRKKLKSVMVKYKVEYYEEMLDAYITEAYKQPSYVDKSNQTWAIDSFKAEKEADCLRYFVEQGDEA